MIKIVLMCALYTQQQWKPITFSVYSPELHGRPMATSRSYDRMKLTCACNTLPLGSVIEIRSKKNPNKAVLVTVTDRMATRFTGIRIDLSSKAMHAIYPAYDITSVKSMRKTETIVRGQYKITRTPTKSR